MNLRLNLRITAWWMVVMMISLLTHREPYVFKPPPKSQTTFAEMALSWSIQRRIFNNILCTSIHGIHIILRDYFIAWWTCKTGLVVVCAYRCPSDTQNNGSGFLKGISNSKEDEGDRQLQQILNHLLTLIWSTILRICGSKPMSSMRSASSSTR